MIRKPQAQRSGKEKESGVLGQQSTASHWAFSLFHSPNWLLLRKRRVFHVPVSVFLRPPPTPPPPRLAVFPFSRAPFTPHCSLRKDSQQLTLEDAIHRLERKISFLFNEFFLSSALSIHTLVDLFPEQKRIEITLKSV